MKRLLISAALCALAVPASCANYVFTDVTTDYAYNAGVVDVPGYGQPWTTPIIFTTASGQTFTTFCDDLDHDVYISGGQLLPYHTGLVTVDGLGRPLTKAMSNIMGQIAGIGLRDARLGNENGAIAAQAALWGDEYGITITSGVTGIEADILGFARVKDDGRGWAEGLISDSGAQSQILGSAVPEPSTWGMVMLGFGVLLMLPRKRRTVAAAIMSLGLIGEAGAVATAPHGSPPAGHVSGPAPSAPGHTAPAPAPAPAAAASAPAPSAPTSTGHCSDPQSSCWYDRWAAEAQTWQGSVLPGSILIKP